MSKHTTVYHQLQELGMVPKHGKWIFMNYKQRIDICTDVPLSLECVLLFLIYEYLAMENGYFTSISSDTYKGFMKENRLKHNQKWMFIQGKFC